MKKDNLCKFFTFYIKSNSYNYIPNKFENMKIAPSFI